MSGKRTRVVPVSIVLALLAAACTGGSATSSSAATSTTTRQVDPNPTQTVSMDDVLGGPQTVQDFFIHVDMRVGQDAESESFYREVLDRATEGAENTVALAGGFEFSSVSNLEGTVVDSTGGSLPHLSVDFGLLTANDQLVAEAQSTLPAEVIEAFGTDSGGASGQMLVEIVTADFTQRRDHLGPGDRTVIDMTFVSKVTPGDHLTSMYIFGQTLPGNPADEIGLNAQELFAYRYNKGLISVLGENGGVDIVADDTVIAVEGSTLVSREAKAALAFASGLRAAQMGARTASEFLSGNLGQGLDIFTGEPETPILQLVISADWPTPALCPRSDDLEFSSEWIATSGQHCRPIDLDHSVSMIMASNFLFVCGQTAAYLNQRNSSGGIPIAELADLGLGPVEGTPTEAASTSSTDQTSTTQPDSSTTTTTTPEPGPSGCEPPPLHPLGPLDFPQPVGGTMGDVHMITFDGVRYDNQAAGEFLVFENDSTTIQMRTQPVSGSDLASVATAVAVRIGEHEVSMHLGGETWVDGEKADLSRGEVIQIGDAELLWGLPGWVIVWPDGTVARINTFTSNLMLFVYTSSSASGMLGDNDGITENDLVSRNGTQLAPNADDDFASFYATYVDSWRITDDESMFHYDSGENTASFTVEGFPSGPSSLDLLDADTRTTAEAVCEKVGLTGEPFLQNCILDVGLTDNPGFAYQGLVFQTAVPEPGAPESPDPTPSPDGSNFVTIGSTLIQFGADPPVTDRNGFSPQWTCESKGGVFTLFSRFPETPLRQVELNIQYLDATASNTGEERFHIVIELNSNPYAWVQSYAEDFVNAVEEITFDGSNLEVTGELYVNEPFSPSVFPLSALPAGAALTPFALHASCG